MKKRRGSVKPFVIGITGGIGTGKSTVARMLAPRGIPVVDADALAHAALRPHTAGYRAARKAFGTVDRRALAKLVFENTAARRRLERIVHPAVIKAIRERVASCRAPAIIVDVPLLIEAGMQRMADAVVVVTAPRAVQIERLARRSKLMRAAILRRIRAQMPLSEKVRLADFVIDNSRSLQYTRNQVVALRRKLWKS